MKSHDERFERLARASIALSQLAPALTQIATNLAAGAQQQAAHSQKVSTQTARMAAELERAVAALDESSHSVREIVSTIKRVADQTRILSINASIEAARAGEFGRAFGAVAQEVEALSGQTMAATGQIGNRVETIQRNIRAAVDAAGLHSAEERRNAHTDSLSIRQLSSDMAEVARIATETAQAAGSVDATSTRIRGLCEELLLEVGTFRMPVHEKASRLFRRLLAVPDLLSSSRMRAETALRQSLRESRVFEVVYVTDARGRQVTSNIWADGRDGSRSFGADWSARPWFTRVIEDGEVSVSDIYRSKASDSFCFTISGPLIDAQGRLAGVLGADVNFAELLSM